MAIENVKIIVEEMTGFDAAGSLPAHEKKLVASGDLVPYSITAALVADPADGSDGAVVMEGDSGAPLVLKRRFSSGAWGGVPGKAGIYNAPHEVGYESGLVKGARIMWMQTLVDDTGLAVGELVSARAVGRGTGGGALWRIVELCVGDDANYTGMVMIEQVDGLAVKGSPKEPVTTTIGVAGLDRPGRRVGPIQGRDRGGIVEKFRPRAGGGWLAYYGEIASLVVLRDNGGWTCRFLDDIGEDARTAWGTTKEAATSAYWRKYPGSVLGY